MSKYKGKSIPSAISNIIFNPENKLKRTQYEAIFMDLIPKLCKEAIEQLEDNSVLILDFYLIFSYLASIIDKINFFVLVTCAPEKQVFKYPFISQK